MFVRSAWLPIKRRRKLFCTSFFLFGVIELCKKWQQCKSDYFIAGNHHSDLMMMINSLRLRKKIDSSIELKLIFYVSNHWWPSLLSSKWPGEKLCVFSAIIEYINANQRISWAKEKGCTGWKQLFCFALHCIALVYLYKARTHTQSVATKHRTLLLKPQQTNSSQTRPNEFQERYYV